MLDAFKLVEAIATAITAEPGIVVSLPAFVALLMAVAAITWRAQRIG